jgi:hypothetical protein
MGPGEALPVARAPRCGVGGHCGTGDGCAILSLWRFDEGHLAVEHLEADFSWGLVHGTINGTGIYNRTLTDS